MRCALSFLAAFLVLLRPAWAESASPQVDATQEAQLIKLPPYVIEAVRGPPWKLVTRPEFEVLSRCPDELTQNLIDRYERLMEMLSLILPASLRPGSDLKTLLILEDAEFQPPVSRELTDAIKERVRVGDHEREISFMPYFHFRDLDSQVIYFLLEEYESERGDVTLAPGFLRYLLESRNPALPRWFIEGMVTLQKTMIMPVPPVGKNILTSGYYQHAKPAFPYDEVRVSPLVWVSPEQTKNMINEVKSMVKISNRAYLPDSFPFVPLRKILQTTRLENLSDTDRALFPSGAALLIRWALDPHPRELSSPSEATSQPKFFSGSRIEALWKFVALSSEQGMSDQLFAQCFGESIDEVEKHLKAYLPIACLEASDFKLSRDTLPIFHDYRIRAATDREIALRKGRLDRLAISYVTEFYPELKAPYLAQARRTLNRSYDRGDRDPMLLAEMGLNEVDANEDKFAQPLLQAAAQKQVVRPRVYFELARIEYQHLRTEHSDLSKAKPQVEMIASLLMTGLSQTPQLAESYQLLFEIWLRQDETLSVERTNFVNKGAMLFPRNFRVIYAAALLQIRAGDLVQARRTLSTALTTFEGTAEEQKLLQLQQALEPVRTQ